MGADETHLPKHPRVAIAGYIGYGNVGDEAMLDQVIRMLQQRGVSDIAVFTSGESAVARFHGVKCVAEIPGSLRQGLRMLLHGQLLEVLGTLRRSDLVVLAGGTVFAGTHLSVLYTWLFRSLLAKFFRCRLVFLSVGVGNLRRGISHVLVRRILALVDACSIRDKDEWRQIGEIAPDRRTVLSADLVFSFPTGGAVLPLPWFSKDACRPTVGFCLPCFFPARHLSDDNARQAAHIYRAAIAGLADNLQASGRYRVVFVSFQSPFDEQEAEQIASRMETPLEIVRLSGHPMEEILSFFASLDYALAMRFHSVVLAAMTLTPFVSIEYSDKVTNLVDELGVRDYSIRYYMWQDQACPLTRDVLVSLFGKMVSNAGDLRSHLEKGLAIFRQRQTVNQELLSQVISQGFQ